MDRSDFLEALQTDVTCLDELQNKLVSMYPSREKTIEQVFFRYK